MRDRFSSNLMYVFKKLLHIASRPIRKEQRQGPWVIHTYRGYGSREEVFLMGRVFHQPELGKNVPEGTLRRDVIDLFRRMVRWGIKDTDVAIDLAGTRTVVKTDRDGYFHAHLRIEHELPTDRIWHTAELNIIADQRNSVCANADIYIPRVEADLIVISDIDDTVMYTGVANKLKMLYRLFLKKAHQRTAFPGVAAFYQALYDGKEGDRQRPMVYVSRGPWSIYEILEEFFNLNRIPVGPILFLREWGLTLQRPWPRKATDHKHHLIQKVMSLYDTSSFVLIGDSGQHDPEVYAQIVRENPDRIAAIYIRNVSNDASRDQAIQRLADDVAQANCALVLAADSARMAEHAHRQGYISAAGLEAVRQDQQCET
ncbi:App1 family protein [Halomonas shantousis]